MKNLIFIIIIISFLLSSCSQIQFPNEEDTFPLQSQGYEENSNPSKTENIKPNIESSISELLKSVPNPSTSSPQTTGYTNDDPELEPIHQYFLRYYNTLATLEPQNIDEIIIENQQTSLLKNMFAYSCVRLRKDNFWFGAFTFELQEIIKEKVGQDLKVTFFTYCENENKSGGVSAEHISYTTLLTNENGWKIKELHPSENGQTFYEIFIQRIKEQGYGSTTAVDLDTATKKAILSELSYVK